MEQLRDGEAGRVEKTLNIIVALEPLPVVVKGNKSLILASFTIPFAQVGLPFGKYVTFEYVYEVFAVELNIPLVK